MNRDPDASELIVEVERYLAAVDVFRAEGCEPSWRPEPSCWSVADDRAQARGRAAAVRSTRTNRSH